VANGEEAPGLVRDHPERYLTDFVCAEVPIEPHEDGPSYCRRVLAGRAAAE
jgi:hypothetical protein